MEDEIAWDGIWGRDERDERATDGIWERDERWT